MLCLSVHAGHSKIPFYLNDMTQVYNVRCWSSLLFTLLCWYIVVYQDTGLADSAWEYKYTVVCRELSRSDTWDFRVGCHTNSHTNTIYPQKIQSSVALYILVIAFYFEIVNFIITYCFAHVPDHLYSYRHTSWREMAYYLVFSYVWK